MDRNASGLRLMAPDRAPIALRPMLPDDGPALAELFIASIEELTTDDYSPAQQAAWAAAADDEAVFAARLGTLLTIVATRAGEVVGFAALSPPDHLHMLFVRPDAARQGVATVLAQAMEKLAGARGATALTVEASDTAQPFFAKQGYEAIRRETVQREDEWLGRTVMRKLLASPPASVH